uniref:phage tail tube protein n=1 Tax=Marinobacterium profundum TaxID=1714300 RepID=UPI00083758BE|nr:hypothetical protein [Marinobacterium profundum]
MAVIQNEFYKGKGTGYLRNKAGSLGFLPIGNASAIDLAFALAKQEMQDYENQGGGTADSISSIESVSASITLLNLNPENIARVTAGASVAVAGGAVSAEVHTVASQGSFVKFLQVPDTDATITVTGPSATPSYVEGTDYEIRNGGILILEGDIAAAAGLEITYTALASRTVEMLTEVGGEYEFYFDGLNEARSGKPVLLTAHRVKINPTTALKMISDDFADAPFTIDLLRDNTITGSEKSKYVKIEMAG